MSYQVTSEQDLIEGDILVLIPKIPNNNPTFNTTGPYWRVEGAVLRCVGRAQYYFTNLEIILKYYTLLSTRTRPGVDTDLTQNELSDDH